MTRMQAKLIKMSPEMIDDIQWLAEMIVELGEQPNFSSTVRSLLHQSLKRELAKTKRGAKYQRKPSRSHRR